MTSSFKASGTAWIALDGAGCYHFCYHIPLCELNDIARPDSGAGLGGLHNLGSFAEAGINHQMPSSNVLTKELLISNL